MNLIRHLIDKKTLKILDLLLKNNNKYYHLSEISNQTKIPIASTYRIINQLKSPGIIDTTIIGKLKIYKISPNKELESIIKK